MGRSTADRIPGKQLFCLLRQHIHQPAAPQRLHNDHRDPLACGVEQTLSTRLRMLVLIVILDLAKIPVIGIQHLAEHLGVAVIGKADLADLSGSLFLRDPAFDAHFPQPLPGVHIVEHVHQVVLHPVGPQPDQLLGKDLVQTLPAFDQIVGQLGGDIHLVPQAGLRQNLPQRSLAAGVNVSGVKVVDPLLDGHHDLPLGLLIVDLAPLLGKPQTAEAKAGQWLALPVIAIIHSISSHFAAIRRRSSAAG